MFSFENHSNSYEKKKKKKSTKAFKHYETRISKMIHRFILEAIIGMR